MPDTLPFGKNRQPEYPEVEARRHLSEKQKAELVLRQGGKCAGCGIKPRAFEYDHSDPLWRGNTDQSDLSTWQAFGSRRDCKCHAIKTGEEAKQRAKRNRLRGRAGQIKRRREKGPSLKSGNTFQRPADYVSTLSRKHPRYVKRKIGK